MQSLLPELGSQSPSKPRMITFTLVQHGMCRQGLFFSHKEFLDPRDSVGP